MKPSRPDAGFSLVEVLVAIGIMGIAFFAFMSTILSQQKEMKFLEQKSEVLEIKNLIGTVLGNSQICGWQMAAESALHPMNMTGVTTTVPSPSTLSLAKIYSGPDNTSQIIFQTGQRVPRTVNPIIAGTTILRDAKASGTPNEYIGEFVVNIDSSSLIHSVAPMSFPIVFATESGDPIDAKKISRCCIGASCITPTATGFITQSISCSAGNNQGNSCPVLVTNDPELQTFGIRPDQLYPMSCIYKSWADQGHAWGGPAPHGLTYDTNSGYLTLSLGQAYLAVDVKFYYGPTPPKVPYQTGQINCTF